VFLALLALLAASANFDEVYRNGLLALQRNDLAAARENLEAAAKMAPQNGRVRIALAQVYLKSGDRAHAEELADLAAKLGPEDAPVRQALKTFESEIADLRFAEAQPLLREQKFAEALNALEPAHRRGPGNAQIELALGVSYYGLRRFEEAAEAFLRTIDLAPDTDQPYLFLGRILDQIPAHWPQATEAFARYETAHPASPAGYLLHAQGLDAQSLDPDRALALLERSIALDGANPAAHFELGNLLDRLNRYADAAREFARAAELNPNDAATHYRLARDYDRLGRAEDAAKQRELHRQLVSAQEQSR
jgi:tetratricopeptide (TPR) repeat protein